MKSTNNPTPTNNRPIKNSRQLDSGLALFLLDQAVRLTIRLAEILDVPALRFSERQRLTRILARLNSISGVRPNNDGVR